MLQIQSQKPIANHQLAWWLLFVFAFLISAFSPLTANAAHFQNPKMAVSGNLTWASAEVGGYGALPGATAPRLGSQSSLLAATIWRGHYLDATGFYGLGARVYDPQSGRFLSPDPLGHASSISLYDYANGDPVNGLDPDGRFGKSTMDSSDSGGMTVSGLSDLDGSAFSAQGDTLDYGSITPPDLQEMVAIQEIETLPIDIQENVFHHYHSDPLMFLAMAIPGVGEAEAIELLGAETVELVGEVAIVSKESLAATDEISAASEGTGMMSENGFVSSVQDTTAEAESEVTKIGQNRVAFQGMEVRAVRDLSHMDDGTLVAMSENGFAPTTVNGDSIVLHHLEQDAEGPLVEIPASNHNIWNEVQHPLGNTPGVGLSEEERAAYNTWRVKYWKARANDELTKRGL